MKVFGYVYLIRNRINGKVYIGQTTISVSKRWSQHLCHARQHKFNMVLHSAIRKYGAASFDVVTLHQAMSRLELDAMETSAIWSHSAQDSRRGYNTTKGGAGISGLRRTAEHCRRISLSLTGKRLTEAHKRAIGDTQRGKPRPEISVALKGKTLSVEQRMKMSQSARLRWQRHRESSSEVTNAR